MGILTSFSKIGTLKTAETFSFVSSARVFTKILAASSKTSSI